MDDIRKRLKLLRKELQLNQTEFAEKTGMTQTWLSMLESGARDISDKTLTVIASSTGANENWLKTGEGEMFANSPYEQEFLSIYQKLSEGTQKHLLSIALELKKAESDIKLNK